jgi:hypothetical protein
MRLEVLKNTINQYNTQLTDKVTSLNNMVPSKTSKIVIPILGTLSLIFGGLTTTLGIITFTAGSPIGIPLIVIGSLMLIAGGLFFGLCLANRSKTKVEIPPFELTENVEEEIKKEIEEETHLEFKKEAEMLKTITIPDNASILDILSLFTDKIDDKKKAEEFNLLKKQLDCTKVLSKLLNEHDLKVVDLINCFFENSETILEEIKTCEPKKNTEEEIIDLD